MSVVSSAFCRTEHSLCFMFFFFSWSWDPLYFEEETNCNLNYASSPRTSSPERRATFSATSSIHLQGQPASWSPEKDTLEELSITVINLTAEGGGSGYNPRTTERKDGHCAEETIRMKSLQLGWQMLGRNRNFIIIWSLRWSLLRWYPNHNQIIETNETDPRECEGQHHRCSFTLQISREISPLGRES